MASAIGAARICAIPRNNSGHVLPVSETIRPVTANEALAVNDAASAVSLQIVMV